MRNIRSDEGGQFSVYDAILFFLILVIGSIIIATTVSSFININPDISAKEYGLQYTDDVLNSVLASTIHNANFTTDGDKYYIPDDTVERAIILYLELEGENGNNCDNISYLIQENLRLAVKGNYHYALDAKYEDVPIPRLYLSDSTDSVLELPDERFASRIETYNGERFVEITLYLWRR